MVIQKKVSKKRAVKASNARVARRNIRANDELIEDDIIEEDAAVEPVVDVAPEASDLLFEAEDVAELVAEVTGEEVAVTADEDAVVFEIGDTEYTVEAEGDEEILESTKVKRAGRKAVKASRKVTRTRARR